MALPAAQPGFGPSKTRRPNVIDGMCQHVAAPSILNTFPEKLLRKVSVDGFWSISVYNAQGYYEKIPYDVYTFNGVTAKPLPFSSAAVMPRSPTACRLLWVAQVKY
jgi:hypothetical protein